MKYCRRHSDSFLVNRTSYHNINSLIANPTKWSNTLKQFVSNLPTNCLSVFDHFVKLALKGLTGAQGSEENLQNYRIFSNGL